MGRVGIRVFDADVGPCEQGLGQIRAAVEVQALVQIGIGRAEARPEEGFVHRFDDAVQGIRANALAVSCTATSFLAAGAPTPPRCALEPKVPEATRPRYLHRRRARVLPAGGKKAQLTRTVRFTEIHSGDARAR